jgi:hypothetical protein
MGMKLIVILAVVLLVLALATQARKSVRAELLIEAPPEEIWTILTDPSTYPSWNPILVTVSGEFAEGATLNVGMKNPDGSVTDVQPVVRRIEPNVEINQFGGMRRTDVRPQVDARSRGRRYARYTIRRVSWYRSVVLGPGVGGRKVCRRQLQSPGFSDYQKRIDAIAIGSVREQNRS